MALHKITLDGVEDMYEVREDREAVIRAISVFKDRGRLENVKKFIKKEKELRDNEDAAIDLIAGDNIKEALGL